MINVQKNQNVDNIVVVTPLGWESFVKAYAKQFGISKSTVHKDVTERLMQINPTLATEARKVLDVNKSERHIRGGLATREKYADIRARKKRLLPR